jgi:hypothetical protein
VRRELRLDGRRPSADELAARLCSFWCSDEVIVYTGLAGTSLRRRVGQYYKTPLGARKPHAGGWWLKTLSILDQLWVHYAATPDNAAAETAMLRHFADGVSATTASKLHDPGRLAPFANLRAGGGTIKAHGITGATGELASVTAPKPSARGPRAPGTPSSSKRRPTGGQNAGAPSGAAVSQNVTAKDLEAGRIRFPRPAKRLFPPERAYVAVVVRGRDFASVRWDPRVNPDQERSGLLAFGKNKLDGVVAVGDVLAVSVGADGQVSLS